MLNTGAIGYIADVPGASTLDMDPFLVEIIRNNLIAATEEMKIVLMRTAYNMIIYEALDFTVGLFTASGETVSIGLGLPMFIRGMSDTVKAKLRHFGADRLRPGDMLLTNDAYTTGSHLNHLTFSAPIFHDGVIIGFSSCMAHWPDVGGTLGGVTKDIYSEGLQIPFVKIYREGQVNEDVMAFIRMNVRLPDRAMGDFRAQVACVRTGESFFMAMTDKYGCNNVLRAIDMIMDQSEAATRVRIRELPKGTFQACAFMDDDGLNLGEHIPVNVKVEIRDEEIAIDLSAMSEQVPGFFNCGETAGLSCCQVAFKCLTSPLELPINAGQFRALKVTLPPGRVVSAVKPAAMRMWMTFPMTVIDTIFLAISPAVPDAVSAGHHADLLAALVHGRKPADGAFYMYLAGLIGGGWGAKHNGDGMSATIAINDGDTHNGPTEQVESKYPLLVEQYALRQDSGGAGRYRGGLGAEQVVRALADLSFSSLVDRTQCRPWGIAGGYAGMANAVGIRRGNENVEILASGKLPNVVIRKGDCFVLQSGGGGGFGAPSDRPIESVVSDIKQGYISRSEGEANYGVILEPDSLAVCAESTRELRERLRKISPAARSTPVEAPAPATRNAAVTRTAPHDHSRIEHLGAEAVEALVRSGRCCG